MNETLRYAQCTPCAAAGKTTTSADIVNGVPVNNQTGWSTLIGLYSGTVFALPQTPPAQPGRPPAVTAQPVHFCPACTAALGIPALQAAVNPSAKPATPTAKAG